MSNDLISRKQDIEAVKRIIQAGLPEEAIYAELEDIPTAYDVDAVCKELPRNARLYGTVRCSCEYAIPKDTALEIVRNGGKKE